MKYEMDTPTEFSLEHLQQAFQYEKCFTHFVDHYDLHSHTLEIKSSILQKFLTFCTVAEGSWRGAVQSCGKRAHEGKGKCCSLCKSSEGYGEYFTREKLPLFNFEKVDSGVQLRYIC